MNGINTADFKTKVDILLKKCGVDVSLLVVSKSISYDLIVQVIQSCKLSIFGENYIQEAIPKIKFVQHSIQGNEEIRWHMIGHLQGNKVNLAVRYFNIIQSVDSSDLLNKINQESCTINKIQNCFLQFKVSHESQKYGMTEADIEDIMAKKDIWKNVNICGMMAIASLPSDLERNRNDFKQARQVFKRLFKSTDVLSMGMTSDYLMAIEEGSSMIRIGTGIFGLRPKGLQI